VLFCSGVVSTRFNAKNQRGQVVSVLGGYGRFKDKLENSECANEVSVAHSDVEPKEEKLPNALARDLVVGT
jgi:hypothetical protein